MTPSGVACLVCRKTCTWNAIAREFASTGVCWDCYRKGLELPDALWCFGSFDSQAFECQFLCPDRTVCCEMLAKEG